MPYIDDVIPFAGPSTNVYQIYAMTQWMADALKDLDTAPNAVKLFVQWCQTAPGNEGRPVRKSPLATKNLLEGH